MVTASTPSSSSASRSSTAGTAQHAGHKVALRAVRVGDADQLNAGQPGEHARMVRAHGADADDANPQRRVILHGLHHISVKCLPPRSSTVPTRLLARRSGAGDSNLPWVNTF